jgi:hypothetical protein
LNPEFLTRTSWAHQAAYHALQDEIDQTIADINSMVAQVLVDTTSSTIGQYETHGNAVWAAFVATNVEVGVLNATECKDNTLALNEESLESSGYRSSNCIKTYNTNVKKEVKTVSDILNAINLNYGEVALNVYRSYISVNPMVDGEAIEQHINATFVSISNQWSNDQPDVNALRVTLTNNINALGNTLNSCFTNAHNYYNNLANIVRDQIDYCKEFGTERASEKIIEDFEKMKENYPEFVW